MSDESPKCITLCEVDGITVIPLRLNHDLLKDGFWESVDWSKRTRIPLRLRVPMPVELIEDEVLDANGRPLTS